MKKIGNRSVNIAIYVDSFIVTRNSDSNFSNLKKLLKQNIEMKELQELHSFLNIKVIKFA